MEWFLRDPRCKEGTHQRLLLNGLTPEGDGSPQTPISYHQLSLEACGNPGGHPGSQGWAARAGLSLLLVKELVDRFDL